ncbi:hypothetical protein ACS0TY_030686 [Phlomoides rotata]
MLFVKYPPLCPSHSICSPLSFTLSLLFPINRRPSPPLTPINATLLYPETIHRPLLPLFLNAAVAHSRRHHFLTRHAAHRSPNRRRRTVAPSLCSGRTPSPGEHPPLPPPVFTSGHFGPVARLGPGWA